MTDDPITQEERDVLEDVGLADLVVLVEDPPLLHHDEPVAS